MLVRVEHACWSDSTSFAMLLLCLAATTAPLDIVGAVQTSRWSLEPPDERGDEEGRIAVLDIGAVVHRTHAES